MKNKIVITVFCVVVLALIGGCQSTTKLEVEALPFSQSESGKAAIPISREGLVYWLTTSATEGIRLFNGNGEIVLSKSGNFEALSINGQWLAVLNVETDSVHILKLNWQTKRLEDLTMLASKSAQIETICWAKNADTAYLFALDTLGIARQFLFSVNNKGKATLSPIRNFTGVLNASACVANDQGDVLYVAEENVGVWQYDTDPESEVMRELLIATAPLGPISSEIKGLGFVQGHGLLISAPDQGGIWHIDPRNSLNPSFYNLQSVPAPEALGTNSLDSTALVAVYDDKTDSYFEITLPLLGESLVNQQYKDTFDRLNAFAQTTPVEKHGDAADDPAIWVNKFEPEKSIVLGTNKKAGLTTYDLSGQQLQHLTVGRVNNVDLRYDFQLADRTIDIAAASNRTTKSISFFAVEQQTGKVTFINDVAVGLTDPYGLCMARLGDDFYVYINSTDGMFEQYLVKAEGDLVSAELVNSFVVPSQPEGCVVDDSSAELFYGEEAAGVWYTSALPSKSQHQLIAAIDEQFVADAEGMGIYQIDNQRFLIVSSQGNNSFAVFALDQNNQYVGSFSIELDINAGIDGVSETDGLEVLSVSFGSGLEDGLLVVQDGRNNLPFAPQNFKFVNGAALKHFILEAIER